MALTWDYTKKAGLVTEVQRGRTFTFDLYVGNAFLMAINEYERDGERFADLQWFFVDELHAKRCLGLAKRADGGKPENMWPADSITAITLHRAHCAHWPKIAELFAKAFPHITITVTE